MAVLAILTNLAFLAILAILATFGFLTILVILPVCLFGLSNHFGHSSLSGHFDFFDHSGFFGHSGNLGKNVSLREPTSFLAGAQLENIGFWKNAPIWEDFALHMLKNMAQYNKKSMLAEILTRSGKKYNWSQEKLKTRKIWAAEQAASNINGATLNKLAARSFQDFSLPVCLKYGIIKQKRLS